MKVSKKGNKTIIEWVRNGKVYVSFIDNSNHDNDYTYCKTDKQMVCAPLRSVSA